PDPGGRLVCQRRQSIRSQEAIIPARAADRLVPLGTVTGPLRKKLELCSPRRSPSLVSGRLLPSPEADSGFRFRNAPRWFSSPPGAPLIRPLAALWETEYEP